MSFLRSQAMVVVAVAGAAATTVSPLAAQHRFFLEPGTRVRITASASAGQRVTGRLLEFTGDRVTLESPDGRTRLVFESEEIARLEISTGRGTGWVRGLGYGALLGAAVGLIYGGTVNLDGTDVPRNQALGFGAGGGAVLGGVVGSMIGAAFPPERWTEVAGPLRWQPRVSASGDLGIGFRFPVPAIQ